MHWSLVWLGYLLTWTAIPHILLRNKPPVSTLAWIWAVILFPYVGTLFYLLFGTDRIARTKVRASREMSKSGERESQAITAKTRAILDQLPIWERRAIETLSRINGVASSSAEAVHLLIDADRFYPALYERIDAAKHHVHVEFFIVRSDSRGEELRDHLTAAARRGVEVRLLLDQVGCLGLRRSFFAPFIEAGGKFAWFRTAHPLRNRWMWNLRNHRKLQIIDGRHAFVGGMNIGREYASEDPRVGKWRDVQVEIVGAAAKKLQSVFADDWYFATEEKLLDRRYYPVPSREQKLIVQAMPDGPDTEDETIQMSIVWMLQSAQQRLWLTAGYFVPNEPLLTALKLAAARGVDVRLLVSGKSDHPYLIRVGRSYYDELLRHGVKIFEYSRGITHAKVALLDDLWVMIGSANFDIRSMRLNFELNVLIRDPATARELESALLQDFEHDSIELSLAEFRRRPFRQRFAESALRPLAPLL
jgi:cardiolipin synthase